jgi:hypothetical protein
VAVAQEFLELLGTLARHEVEFVVVGATAAALDGAPLGTYDLDIVPEPSKENRLRLLQVLQVVDAVYFDPLQRRIRPSAERLSSQRLHLLETRLGRLDVMMQLNESMAWTEVAARSHLLEVEGRPVRVLNLDAVIESKELANREKDRLALPVLRQTLQLMRRKGGSGDPVGPA